MTCGQKSVGRHHSAGIPWPVGVYSRYVGRVGALAAIAGVGIALTFSPAVALAETDGTTSTNTVDDRDTGVDPTEGDDETEDDETADDGTEVDETEDSDPEIDESVGDEPETAEVDETGGDPDDGESTEPEIDNPPTDTTTETPVTSTTTTVSPPSSPTQRAEDAQSGAVPGSASDSEITSTAERTTASIPAAAPATVIAPSEATVGPTSAAKLFSITSEAEATATTTFATGAPQALEATLLGPVATPIVGVLSRLVGMVVSPFVLGSPAGPPAAAPALFAVLAFVRGEFERAFFNRSPIATPPTNGLLTGNVGATDPDDDTLTYTVVSGPSVPGATATVAGDGTYTYTPTAGQLETGDTDEFTVLVTDEAAGLHFHGIPGLLAAVVRVFSLGSINLPDGHTTLVRVPVTIPRANTAPVAVADSYTATEDTFLTIPATAPAEAQVGVLANDTDPEGDPLTAQLVTGPTNGALELNEDGSFTYTPDADFYGTDSFTYTVTDGTATSNAATVTLAVAPVSDPPRVVATIGGVTTPNSVAVSPDGTRAYVANTASDTLTVIDTTTNTVIDTDDNPTNGITPIAVGDGPVAVAVSPDGTRAYVVNYIGASVMVIDTTTNTVIDTDDNPTNGITPIAVAYGPNAVAVGPDGTRAYVTVSTTDAVTVIDTTTNTVIDTDDDPANGITPVTVGDVPTGVAVSPDGTRAYVVNISDGTVTVIYITTNEATDLITAGYGPSDVALNPDGTRAYVTNQYDDTVTVIDTTTNTVIDTDNNPTNGITPVTVGNEPYSVAVSPDGTRAYVTNLYDDTVTVIDTTTNTVIDTDDDPTNGITPITVGDFPFAVAFSPDGTRAYVTNQYDGTVTVIDTGLVPVTTPGALSV